MKNRFLTLLGATLRNQYANKGTKGKIGGLAGVALVIVITTFYSVWYSNIMYEMTDSSVHIYITEMMIFIGCVLTVMVGISGSQALLFGFKDYDLLMSLPFTKRNIVSVKTITYLLAEYLYSIFFILGAMAYYGIDSGQGPLFYILAFIGGLFVPLGPAVVAALLGLAIKRFSSGSRFENLINNGGNLIAIVVVIVAVNVVLSESADYVSMVSAGKYPFFLAHWYVLSMKNPLWLLALAAVSLLLALVFVNWVSPIIIALNERGTVGYHVKDFKIVKTKVNSRFMAMFKKEFKRCFTNFYLVLNRFVMMIMLTGLSIYALVRIDDVRAFTRMLGSEKSMIEVMLVLAVGFAVQMTSTTDTSISLEGKSLWVIKTLPVSTPDIFLSKIAVNLTAVLPLSLLSLLLLGIVFEASLFYYVLGILHLLASSGFVALLGLYVNLLFPRLDFDNEAQVIKRSASTFIGTFAPLVLGVIVVVVLINFEWISWLALAGVYVFYMALDVILALLVFTQGVKIFAKL